MKTRVFAVCVVVFLFCGITHAGLSDGLVAYYPFNGNANDESENGNNGTVHGATLAMDKFGNNNAAYYFNGNSYISINDSNSFDLNSLTISAWFSTNTLEGYQDIFRQQKNTDFGGIIGLRITGNQIEWIFFAFGEPSGKQGKTLNANLSTNQWYHVAWTKDHGQCKVYVNGVEQVTNNSEATDQTSRSVANPYIGVCNDGFGFNSFLNGTIDGIRIYNRALSETEIHQLYSGMSPSIVVKPYTFTTGTPAKAAEVNADFDVLYTRINALNAIVCQDHPTASICQ
jgi:hypothetical protein